MMRWTTRSSSDVESYVSLWIGEQLPPGTIIRAAVVRMMGGDVMIQAEIGLPRRVVEKVVPWETCAAVASVADLMQAWRGVAEDMVDQYRALTEPIDDREPAAVGEPLRAILGGGTPPEPLSVWDRLMGADLLEAAS